MTNTDQMEQTQMSTSAASRYGGFWRRVLASLIDFVILQIPLVLLFGYERVMDFDDSTFFDGQLETAGFLISLLYSTLMESSKFQGTLGKMALGMKVTDLQGNRISFLRALGRHLAKIVSALILFIGFLMVAFTQRKQGLHDKMAGTLVVKSR